LIVKFDGVDHERDSVLKGEMKVADAVEATERATASERRNWFPMTKVVNHFSVEAEIYLYNFV